MKKYYLIYQIRNKLNGMIYVGKHMTSNKDDGYMGSGIRIQRALKKYGVDNFEKTILFKCQSEKEMNQKESEIVNEDFIARDDVYNICLGGNGGWNWLNNDSSYVSGSSKRHNAIIKANKNRDQNKAHEKSLITRQKWTDEKRQKVSQAISEGIKRKIKTDKEFAKRRIQSLRGRKVSEQLRQKLSNLKVGENNNQYGKVWIMNKELRQCRCVEKTYVLEPGWEYGRCCDFNAKERKQKQKQKQIQYKLLVKEQKKNDRIQLLRDMYKFFVEHDNNFDLMAETFGFSHTRNSFMTQCKRYLPEYIPLPNNRWKNRK